MFAAGAAALTIAVAGTAGAGAAGCATKTLTSADSGHAIALTPCQQVKISLSESSDGGYIWTVVTAPKAKVLKLVSNTTVQPPEPSGAVGGSDTRVFVFRALRAGSTKLNLAEARSFQKGSTVATFALTVTVK